MSSTGSRTGIDPEIIHQAETVAASVPGAIHAHARARWTGRTLLVEIEAGLTRT